MGDSFMRGINRVVAKNLRALIDETSIGATGKVDTGRALAYLEKVRQRLEEISQLARDIEVCP